MSSNETDILSNERNIEGDIPSNEMNIIFALDSANERFIINRNYFENNKMISDATVLMKLLGFHQGNFGNFPIKRDDNGNVLIFKDLDVTKLEWFYLCQYLKNGLVSLPTLPLNDQIQLMENINWTATKLGGVPSFDKFYADFYQKLSLNNNYYNPKCPEEDHLNKFHWRLELSQANRLRSFFSDQWYSTKHFRMGLTDFVWWRKEKIQLSARA